MTLKGGWICPLGRPFYGLTLNPEDKIRIHQDIFHLVYNSNGGFTHDEVYTMPVFLRYFYIQMLIEQKERENKQTTQAQDDVVRKSPSRPIVKKPF